MNLITFDREVAHLLFNLRQTAEEFFASREIPFDPAAFEAAHSGCMKQTAQEMFFFGAGIVPDTDQAPIPVGIARPPLGHVA